MSHHYLNGDHPNKLCIWKHSARIPSTFLLPATSPSHLTRISGSNSYLQIVGSFVCLSVTLRSSHKGPLLPSYQPILQPPPLFLGMLGCHVYPLHPALSLSALPRFNLWLIVPPTPTIDPEVWTSVCLADISAMDYGRARLWSAPSNISSSHCTAHFWYALQSFASSSQHLHWTLPATHPFLCTVDGIIQVNAPLPPPTITLT
jgi:hypothetical protein